ncbi:hypothetical protein H4R33_004198 [Dimargaris cristalligena]|nr:hypothetical protein H4R33_004198 [Dimargaris cristalligena]
MRISYTILLSLALATGYTVGGCLPSQSKRYTVPLPSLTNGEVENALLCRSPIDATLSVIHEVSEDDLSTYGDQNPESAVEDMASGFVEELGHGDIQAGDSRITVFYDARGESAFSNALSDSNSQYLDDNASSDDESVHSSNSITPSSSLQGHSPYLLATPNEQTLSLVPSFSDFVQFFHEWQRRAEQQRW